MVQFSSKRLFVAVTLIAAGAGVAAYFWHHADRLNQMPISVAVAVAVTFLCLPGFLIGAGLFSLVRQPAVLAVAAGLVWGVLGALLQLVIGTMLSAR